MAIKISKIRVTVDEYGMGSVEIDGKDISNAVSALRLDCKMGETPVVQIDFVGAVEIIADANVFQKKN